MILDLFTESVKLSGARRAKQHGFQDEKNF
jgi:hypothetical protein